MQQKAWKSTVKKAEKSLPVLTLNQPPHTPSFLLFTWEIMKALVNVKLFLAFWPVCSSSDPDSESSSRFGSWFKSSLFSSARNTFKSLTFLLPQLVIYCTMLAMISTGTYDWSVVGCHIEENWFKLAYELSIWNSFLYKFEPLTQTEIDLNLNLLATSILKYSMDLTNLNFWWLRIKISITDLLAVDLILKIHIDLIVN